MRSGNSVALMLAAAIPLSACESEVTDHQSALENARRSTVTVSSDARDAKQAYFGDTHVHTQLSMDAYLFGTRRTPDDAYRFAKGESIRHASGLRMQLDKPLDFLAVTDHADFLGMAQALGDPNGGYKDHELAASFRATTDIEGSNAAFARLVSFVRSPTSGGRGALDDQDVLRSAWQEIIDAAQRHNQPGEFTAFVGYEYTSAGPQAQNLHRNVIFRSGKVPELPFSHFVSRNPEDLWTWMDEQRRHGIESLAIPHNSNGSDGWMFAQKKWDGSEPDADWAVRRMRNEPVVENTQVKGTSDTHPLLSPNDEWADFEIMPVRVAITNQPPSQPSGSYVREALLNGLLLEQALGVNPFQFGVIGSSDSHNAAGSYEEDNYWSKLGVSDIEAYQRGSVPLPDSTSDDPRYANEWSKYWGASGLAGVWAVANTREAIFDAMQRRETFSTSGPRIKLRFFAGYGLGRAESRVADVVDRGSTNGVPMGGELPVKAGSSPDFYVWATRDPGTQALQRVQLVKGWLDDGTLHEQVFDVACSDGLSVDPATFRCPDNGATVDLRDCTTTADTGDAELAVVWQDPSFNPGHRAFYYARVLENPSCRWSTYDALRAGVAPRPDMPATIQERAWSSPIWIVP